MSIMDYWIWLSDKGLVKTRGDKALIKNIDALLGAESTFEEKNHITNLAYWFECQFEVPSTDERRVEYAENVLSEARGFFGK